MAAEPIHEFSFHTIHDSSDIWQGISGNHVSLSQILNEFVDNALSNLRANAARMDLERLVFISVQDNGDTLNVTISDTGTGICNPEKALMLACRSAAETPLNEHGFGLKHALASADPDNRNWWIRTRTDLEALENQYIQISAPYCIGENAMKAFIHTGNGGLPRETGTMIGFTCSKYLLQQPSGKRLGKTFDVQMAVLAENLGYTYSKAISDGELSIHLTFIRKDGSAEQCSIAPAEPVWAIHFDHPACTVDLGGGPVEIHCRYGLMHKKSGADYKNHYKVNMRCSGVEIRINGRTIASGLLSEIWAAAQHNARNRFLAIVDLCCPDSNALPDTKSAKNGFREGDPKLANLYQWLRSTVPLPHVSTPIEAVLMNHLAEVKRTDAANLLVCREERVFKELPLKASVDLLVSTTDGITIYEGKVHCSKAQDVYQLQMYADGCAHDGCPVKEAILVAETHPDGVRSLVNHINQTHDLEYSLRLTTWAEERIPYEALLNNCRY